MHIVHIENQKPERAYGIACRHFFPNAESERPPFGSSFCTVAPGEVSERHNHHEYECFYICEGKGQIVINGEPKDIQAGDAIFIPAFQNHTIANPQGNPDLKFITFWWENSEALKHQKPSGFHEKQTVIFTAPPTPNGDLHLGHLSGPFTGADIYRRYLLLRGVPAFHSCGRDDNQSYVPRKALMEGREPIALADENSSLMLKTLSAANVVLDNFHCPNTSALHPQMVRQAFTQLYENGFIYAREADTAYCKETGKYLYEAHISGTCPHCGQGADGNACEQCGQPNDCADLIEPRSKYGSKGVEIRKTKRLFFKLSAFADRLRAYHADAIIPTHLAALCKRMLAKGLPDICVAHISDWGIPVPVKGFENHRIYVWFEMAFGYLSSVQELCDKKLLGDKTDWREVYTGEDTHVVHFFGFDNGYFHMLLLPAIYLAYESDIRLPEAYVVNELLSLDGKKFSTSRNHLIWGRDLLSIAPPDYVRFYLSYIRPETAKNNFTLPDFEAVVNGELASQWQTWLDSVYECGASTFGGSAPEPGAWTLTQRRYYERLLDKLDSAAASYQSDDFSPQRLCRMATEIVREADRLCADQEHLRAIPQAHDEFRTAFALQLLTAKILAVMIAPIMPDFAERLWESLAGQSAPMTWNAASTFLPHSSKLSPPQEPFFVTISTAHLSSNPQPKAA